MSIHSTYLEDIFQSNTTFRKTIRNIVKELKQLSFNYLVGTGLSGTCITPIVALRLNKPFVILRKGNSHASIKLEGLPNDKHDLCYLILDDFIDTGKTVKTIIDEIEKNRLKDICIGMFSYESCHFGFQNHSELLTYPIFKAQ